MNGYKKWAAAGALLMAVAVGLGAFGAHGLENWLPTQYESIEAEKRLESWETGVRYHMAHALGMIFIGTLMALSSQAHSLTKTHRSFATAGVLFGIGISLFSGGLYGWVLLDSRPLVMIVPLGGLAFMVGWGVFALGVARMKLSASDRSEREARDGGGSHL